MSASKGYTVWPRMSIDRAMALKGRVSTRAAERITGIPAATISGWWSGRVADPYRGPGRRGTRHKPRTHCLRGHKLTPANTIWIPSVDRVQCRRCKRVAERARNWRRRNRFHPRWNPNLELAPIKHLWFHGPSLIAELEQRFAPEELRPPALESKHVDMFKRWKFGVRTWVGYESVDEMCMRLGFPASGLALQPVYATHPSTLSREVAA